MSATGHPASAGAGEDHGTVAGAAVRWRPVPTTTPWQWQLQGHINLAIPAPVYDVDGFETPASTVRRLHGLGRRVICYIDAGSWESYRPDAGSFPRAVLGHRYAGFPDERWLDIRHFHSFAAVLERRFLMCAQKGFDAVEPDNLAGWENDTGFPITRTDQLRFNLWVARHVHALGLAVALKNDGRQAGQLVDDFDFAIVEQCFRYRECGFYRTFIRHGKAVYETEYGRSPGSYCSAAQALDFSAIGKSISLFARPWRPCPG
jgi:hypothetical protein